MPWQPGPRRRNDPAPRHRMASRQTPAAGVATGARQPPVAVGDRSYGRSEPAMTERRRRPSTPIAPAIDAALLARAIEVNEAVAGEFAEQANSPLENPVIERMAELGVE